MANAGGGRIHAVSDMVATYRHARQLRRDAVADDLEQQLRRLCAAVTDTDFPFVFVGRSPKSRRYKFCKIVGRSGPFVNVEFQDGTVEGFFHYQIKRRKPEAPGGPRCKECGDAGSHIQLVDGLCSDCRIEATLQGETPDV